MNAFDPAAYKISIQRRLVEDHPYFVGNVTELPDVEVYEDTYEAAYSALLGIITDLNAAATKHGRHFPAPSVKQEQDACSGRITLRVPRTLHEKAVEIAKQEDVSLNLYLTSIISEAVGSKQAKQVLTEKTSNTFYSVILESGQNNTIVRTPTTISQTVSRH